MDRRSEWSVPKFGPERFRVAIGILFLPYTGMVMSFTLIGSMLAEKIYWDRVGAILAIYFLALGVGANALDAVGSKKVRPWGTVFSLKQLWISALTALILAYSIGIYYMVLYTPFLWIIAILEGFFLLAYNLEWFGGRLHTDECFAFSWGFLPVLAGYVLQTNSISFSPFVLALAAGLLGYVEITAERPYKDLKRMISPTQNENELSKRYERILKSISIGTIFLGIGMAIWKWGY